jgi:hypothetical protein
LRALGRGTELAQSSLRLSFGRFTTADDIDTAVRIVAREVSRLRSLAGGAPIAGVDPMPVAAEPDSLEARSLNALARRYFRAGPCPPLDTGVLLAGHRRGQAGRSADGTAVSFELEIAGGIVKSARSTCYGCPHTLAVAAWVRESLEGAPADAARLGTPFDWAAKFAVPHEKLGRLLVVEDALRAALG